MKRKDILMILVPIFIIVVFWIGFSIYHGIVSSTISEVENLQITPISPDFDTKTIQGLKKRQTVTPTYQINATSQSPGLPTPTPSSQTPLISSESAEQASPGGSLSQ